MGIVELCNALEQLDKGQRRWHDVNEVNAILNISQANVRRLIRSHSGVHVESDYINFDGEKYKLVAKLLD